MFADPCYNFSTALPTCDTLRTAMSSPLSPHDDLTDPSSFVSSPQSSHSSTGPPLIPYPSWLRAALTSTTYLRRPLFVLGQREAQRGSTTAASRRRTVDIDVDSEDSEVEHDTLDHAYFTQVASLPENAIKNRYAGVEPYDWNRVRVGLEARYLNASWVREVEGGRWWIAAQVCSTPYSALVLVRSNNYTAIKGTTGAYHPHLPFIIHSLRPISAPPPSHSYHRPAFPRIRKGHPQDRSLFP